MKKILTIIAILAAAWLYSGPLRAAPGVYNSPDEQVTAVFLARFALAGTLALPHPFSVGAENEFLHPRSAFADLGSYALPVGFWGLPVLYGALASWFSVAAAPYFTLFLIVIMAAAMRRLAQVVFPGISSFAVFMLTLFQPAVWYYAARPFLPNVPFVCLLLIGIVWLITRPFASAPKKKLPAAAVLDDVMGAGLIGVALLIRPNEIWWMAGAAAIILVAYRREISWSRFIVWGAVGAFMLVFYIYFNKLWYGAAAGGYVVSRSLPLAHWWSIFFPFGVHPRAMLASGYTYGLQLWPWLIAPALIFGAYIFWKKRQTLTKSVHVYGAVTLWIGIFLWVYYGSWQDATYGLKTIGVAYVRYWLPIFLLLVPFTVLAYQWLAERVRLPRLGLFIIVSAVLGANTWAVYHGLDGLTNLTAGLKNGQILRDEIVALTLPGSIIVTERQDKFVWPARQVMVHLENPRVQQAVFALVGRGVHVYWLTPTESKEFSLIDVQLRERGVTRHLVKQFNMKQFDNLTLYQFTK